MVFHAQGNKQEDYIYINLSLILVRLMGKKWDESKIENLEWGGGTESRRFRKTLWGEVYKLLLFKNKTENLWRMWTDIQIISPPKTVQIPAVRERKEREIQKFWNTHLLYFLETTIYDNYTYLWLLISVANMWFLKEKKKPFSCE